MLRAKNCGLFFETRCRYIGV